jgi:hypothetical protein
MGDHPPDGHLHAGTCMNRSVEGQDKPGLVILKRKSGIKGYLDLSLPNLLRQETQGLTAFSRNS